MCQEERKAESGASKMKSIRVSFLPDPLSSTTVNEGSKRSSSWIVQATVPLETFFGGPEMLSTFQEEGGRVALVALSDFVARKVTTASTTTTRCNDESTGRTETLCLQVLDQALEQSRLHHHHRRRRKNRKTHSNPKISHCAPYVLERSDIWCSTEEEQLNLVLRLCVSTTETNDDAETMVSHDDITASYTAPTQELLAAVLFDRNDTTETNNLMMAHIATVVLQDRLRKQVVAEKAVAFVADGSILPRKSGTSDLPMSTPPAVPFRAPDHSSMTHQMSIEMGRLASYLPNDDSCGPRMINSTASFRGLLIPAGITLICGGGYHGKSTLLTTIAKGIYNKVPNDGREFCVAVPDAVTVRAEDGRYVHNCNISAFISNLPTPPGAMKALDTAHFSTRDASGSTSQAANVAEAIEMGATAMLVDEDVSAANFMARDGRMRALVMDESITPLLYRVNGLYQAHGISSVVVVGGVGDWLDVPHNVLLLDKYVASDATKKAQSISYQFSYGHVQYAGKGVVHRLEWEKRGTPTARRPTDKICQQYCRDVAVSLLDGGNGLALSPIDSDVADDEDHGCIQASRMEQLLDKKQLYGTGIAVVWLVQHAFKSTGLGLRDLLLQLDEKIDNGGMVGLLTDLEDSMKEESDCFSSNESWIDLATTVGFAHRPRRFEVGQALARMNGMQFEELPVPIDDVEEAARLEAERKKQSLLDLWAARRNK